ncbi:hypothetical protein ACFTRE_17940, partial [Bacillus subtilis]
LECGRRSETTKGDMKMSLYDYLQRKKEEEREAALKAEKEAHKCNGCVWGSWAGNKYVCMFRSCIKKE